MNEDREQYDNAKLAADDASSSAKEEQRFEPPRLKKLGELSRVIKASGLISVAGGRT